MSEEKLLACPFCGTEESERDGTKGTQHKDDCYIILMETELPNSPLRIMAWNRRAGDRQPATPETVGVKALASATLLDSTAKETLEHAERVLDTMATFYRHSETWKMMRGSECLEKIRKLRAVQSNVESSDGATLDNRKPNAATTRHSLR
jgi:hypothetical protein